jgi:endonuclease/exonuclease/phosphatase (EEP) superfamily protein YafD
LSKSNIQLQAALSLLQYHIAHMPEAVMLPEFKQIQQRETAMLRAAMYDVDIKTAQELFISSVAEFDEVLQDLTESDLHALRVKSGRKFLEDDFRL